MEAIGSEHWFDAESGATIINETTIPNSEVFAALNQQHPEVAALVRWGTNTKRASRAGSFFERDRYVTPDSIFNQFKVSLDAAESDDVVSGIVESTEALAFKKISVSCPDENEEDIWNQIIDEIELDRRLREMWRETFIVSQFYAAVIWGTKDFKVQKKTKNGNRSKKTFTGLRVPVGLTVLDPLKVVPVGNTLFGQDKLAYIASRDEAPHFDEVLAGVNSSDQVVNQLISGRYLATREEKQWIQQVTDIRDLDNLYILNPENVFRHTATKPDYQRFATVRMKSVFEILDLKNQLRQMDRAYLLGGTNFIILVKKGTDELPAEQGEVNALATQVAGTARVPVIVSDHRIDIEIITPPMDTTLKPERYNTLDARLTARLYQMFMTGNYAAGASGDDSLKLARVVAAGMESRRFMIYKTLERNIFKRVFEINDAFTDKPSFNFHPKRIALEFDNNVATFLQDLRDRGDISRETLLSEVDIDQDEEALKREREAVSFDKIFEPPAVPYSGQGSQTPKAAGRQGGGNKNGGGANRQSGVSQPGRGTKPENRVKNKTKPSNADESQLISEE